MTDKTEYVPLGWQSFKTLDQIIAAYNQRRWMTEEKPMHVKDDA